MRLLNGFSTRMNGLLRREAVLRDMNEEMRFHLDMETEANVEKGMTPAEARRAALRSFGNFDSIRKRAWEVRGGGMIETFLQDVRYGARVLVRNKAFTAVAVLTLALGIGANTAIFSVVNELLLRPLPYTGAERIVMVWEVSPGPDGRSQNPTSRANFRSWREQATSFEAIAAFTDQRLALSGNGEPEEVTVQFATPELFRVLGVKPILGRGITPEDGKPDSPDVVVLGNGFWRRRFGGDPEIIGKTITLNANPFVVVGVLPAGFQWHIKSQSASIRPAEVWTVLSMPTEGPASYGRFLSSVARLKPGVTFEQADAEMKTLAARRSQEIPEYNKGFSAEVLSLREQLVGKVRPALLILLGAVGFVLLIACVNVANLLLSRAAAREKEIALRTALGAAHSRIVRQLLTESLLLAFLGGLLGLGLAWVGLRALVAISPRDLVDLQGVGLNLPVLALMMGISLLTGILFGLVPAFEATRLNLNATLKEGGKGSGGQSARSGRLRGALVVAEIALALVLLASAGLLVKSFVRLQQIDTGFETENVLTMVVSLPSAKYDEDRKMIDFFRRAKEEMRALPGVRSAGMVNFLPLYGGLGSATGFTIDGRPTPPPGEEPATSVRVADTAYFEAMGIPVLRGRSFSDVENREARHVVLINESLARQHFPNENPLGKRLDVQMFEEPRLAEIIGVVGDVRYDNLTDEARPTVYFPHSELTYRFMTLVLRTAGDPADVAAPAQGVVRRLDKDQPVSDVRTMEQVMANTVGRARFNTLLLGLFAALATVLATIGIFGVMSYSVNLRTREIGLRMALGAQRAEVLMLVLKQGLLLTLIGVALGLAGALALTRTLSSLLFGVGSTDPATFATIVLFFVLVAVIACYLPARKATRVDPLIALRHE